MPDAALLDVLLLEHGLEVGVGHESHPLGVLEVEGQTLGCVVVEEEVVEQGGGVLRFERAVLGAIDQYPPFALVVLEKGEFRVGLGEVHDLLDRQRLLL